MESRLHFRIHAALNSLKGSPAGTPWHSETTPNAARVRNMNPGIFLIMERFRCVWGWEITSTWTRFFCITSNMLFYLNFPYLFMYFFKALNDGINGKFQFSYYMQSAAFFWDEAQGNTEDAAQLACRNTGGKQRVTRGVPRKHLSSADDLFSALASSVILQFSVCTDRQIKPLHLLLHYTLTLHLLLRNSITAAVDYTFLENIWLLRRPQLSIIMYF